MNASAQAVVLARAKVNLALHVVGQRADGYHLLESIVVFAALGEPGGDRVTVEFGEPDGAGPALAVSGPFASKVPPGPGNSAFDAALSVGGVRRIALEKHLPVAAGIGGGSANAAAVLQAVAAHRGEALSRYHEPALKLGADVPVCLLQRSARMHGIGENVDPIGCPALPCVLINPGVEVSTPAVFKALTSRRNAPLPAWPSPPDVAAVVEWLTFTRNDLEAAAMGLAPSISDALAALRATAGCLLARMSGSGATVFGLFADRAARDRAAADVAAQHPNWWVAKAILSDEGDTSRQSSIASA